MTGLIQCNVGGNCDDSAKLERWEKIVPNKRSILNVLPKEQNALDYSCLARVAKVTRYPMQ